MKDQTAEDRSRRTKTAFDAAHHEQTPTLDDLDPVAFAQEDSGRKKYPPKSIFSKKMADSDKS